MRKHRRITPLALMFIVLSMLLLTAVQPSYAEETIYSVGDWLKYRIYTKAEFLNMSFECDFIVRIDIEKIEGTSVTLSSSVDSVKKGNGMCTAMMTSFSGRSTVDVKQLTPRGGAMIIDPTYTGEYDINGIKVTYNKGVLTKLTGKTSSMGMDLSIIVELVDTSIAELKGISMLSVALAILIIVATIAIALAVTMVMLRRVKRAAMAPSTPTTPST